MTRQQREEYGYINPYTKPFSKELKTRLNKSASDFREEPLRNEKIKDDVDPTDNTEVFLKVTNRTLIDKNIKLEKENEYLQVSLGEAQSTIQQLETELDHLTKIFGDVTPFI